MNKKNEEKERNANDTTAIFMPRIDKERIWKWADRPSIKYLTNALWLAWMVYVKARNVHWRWITSVDLVDDYLSAICIARNAEHFVQRARPAATCSHTTYFVFFSFLLGQATDIDSTECTIIAMILLVLMWLVHASVPNCLRVCLHHAPIAPIKCPTI